MIPGLQGGLVDAGSVLNLDTSENDVDVWDRVGSPAEIIHLTIWIDSGVVIGGRPALDVTGLTAGSRVIIMNEGRIQGQGGDGGQGDRGQESGGTFSLRGGGGGGGVGTPFGLKGLGRVVGGGANGDDGTDGGTELTTEGIGGANEYVGEDPRSFISGDPPLDGGDAIASDAIKISINNINGQIWGGGGGGDGGRRPPGGPNEDGWDGGDAAEDAPGTVSGSAGYAIRGSDVTFINGGSSPNVEGTVG